MHLQFITNRRRWEWHIMERALETFCRPWKLWNSISVWEWWVSLEEVHIQYFHQERYFSDSKIYFELQSNNRVRVNFLLCSKINQCGWELEMPSNLMFRKSCQRSDKFGCKSPHGVLAASLYANHTSCPMEYSWNTNTNTNTNTRSASRLLFMQTTPHLGTCCPKEWSWNTRNTEADSGWRLGIEVSPLWVNARSLPWCSLVCVFMQTAPH